eukprot:CFRG3095T1
MNIAGFDLDIFALSSAVGKKIEEATSELLVMEDWALNLEITDMINASNDGPNNSVRAIKKRLGNKNERVVMLALTLLEACVQNCGTRFHIAMCSKDLFPRFESVAEKRSVPGEKARQLLAEWVLAFQPKRQQMPNIYSCYRNLVESGVEFPEVDPSKVAPIEMDQPNFAVPDTETRDQNQRAVQYARNVQPEMQSTQSGRIAPSDRQTAKLMDDLEIVRGNVDVMAEMVNALGEGENPTTSELLNEINLTTRAMQQRILILISQVESDNLMNTLLQVNDQLVNLFEEYDKKVALFQTNADVVAQPMPGTTYSTEVGSTEADYPVVASPVSNIVDELAELKLDYEVAASAENTESKVSEAVTEEDFEDFLNGEALETETK